MNGIVRNVLRVTALKNVVSPTINATKTNSQISRMLWNMCSRPEHNAPSLTARVTKVHNEFCECGGCRAAHTKGKSIFFIDCL